jgi:lipopolysaccharide biosynthesis protein
MPTELARPFDGAQTYWSYTPSRPSLRTVMRRWVARCKRIGPPAWRLLKVPSKGSRWIMYFVFAPQGQLTAHHRYTLEQLAKEDVSLMIVCACPPSSPVLQTLDAQCDALCWKAPEGYDFSAYAVGLTVLARDCPGADVLVLNDSMLGPFAPLAPFLDQAPWRLTGLTASALSEENHLQSFAFIVRGLDETFLQALSPTISTEWSYDSAEPVILLQETQFARVAHQRGITVGSYWYTDGSQWNDLCLNRPQQLIEAGFPFIKRSLFEKFATTFQKPEDMRALLERVGHPAVSS